MNMMRKVRNFRCIICKTLHRNYSGNSVRTSLQNETPNHERKRQNAKILRRFNQENKSLFGSLVETLPQKKKREKSEPLHEQYEFPATENDRSAEALWWKTSRTRPISRQKSKCQTETFTLHKLDVNHKTADIHDSFHHNMEDVSGNGGVSNEGTSENKLGQNDEKFSSIIFHKSNVRMPQIMVKNITAFPLDPENKHISRNTLSSSILSIPMKEESESVNSRHLGYPSVSKILNATMSDASRAALQRWRENMIAELGEEGFLKYQSALLEHGSIFHNTVQKYLSGVPDKEISIDPAVEGCWNSLESTLKDIRNVKALESHVVHQQLLYHGIIDCVAAYKGKYLLIEWKKSNKKKPLICNTYDAPLQVVAYIGAMNNDLNYNIKVRGGLVVVAYTDGSPASVHYLSRTECHRYWYLWLKRLQQYWNLINQHDMTNNVPNAISL